MSGTINILLSTLKGSKHTAQLKEDFTIGDIRKIVADKMGSANFRLVTQGEEIQDNDPQKFSDLRKKIKNGTTIYVCQRMDGGVDTVDLDSHRGTIIVDLQQELGRVKSEPSAAECVICTEEKACIRICCSTIICKECFPNYFIYYNYKIPCLICDRLLPPEKVFVTRQFISSLKCLEETTMMLRNIDFQICTCGAYAINSTLYAKQQCTHCQRWLCFFCNSDWNETDGRMRSDMYTCKNNCLWETKITYQLLKLEFNRDIEVPNRRCCPKCLECGSYDNKCKYHKCKCGYVFCFICLKSKADCIREFKSEFNVPCDIVAKQTFAIFPCIDSEHQKQHEQQLKQQKEKEAKRLQQLKQQTAQNAGGSCVIL